MAPHALGPHPASPGRRQHRRVIGLVTHRDLLGATPSTVAEPDRGGTRARARLAHRTRRDGDAPRGGRSRRGRGRSGTAHAGREDRLLARRGRDRPPRRHRHRGGFPRWATACMGGGRREPRRRDPLYDGSAHTDDDAPRGFPRPFRSLQAARRRALPELRRGAKGRRRPCRALDGARRRRGRARPVGSRRAESARSRRERHDDRRGLRRRHRRGDAAPEAGGDWIRKPPSNGSSTRRSIWSCPDRSNPSRIACTASRAITVPSAEDAHMHRLANTAMRHGRTRAHVRLAAALLLARAWLAANDVASALTPAARPPATPLPVGTRPPRSGSVCHSLGKVVESRREDEDADPDGTVARRRRERTPFVWTMPLAAKAERCDAASRHGTPVAPPGRGAP